jgi:hypothetical protein
LQGSFWAQLADDTGTSPTPRELAIASIDNNFKAIRALGFDTVTIGLPDSDNWVSQHGGGFSYDPKNPAAARPEFAVAQEIVLRIADAHHSKVIFAIGLSEYRRSSDGRAAWAGLADEYDSTSKPQGAYVEAASIEALQRAAQHMGCQEKHQFFRRLKACPSPNRIPSWRLGLLERVRTPSRRGPDTHKRQSCAIRFCSCEVEQGRLPLGAFYGYQPFGSLKNQTGVINNHTTDREF